MSTPFTRPLTINIDAPLGKITDASKFWNMTKLPDAGEMRNGGSASVVMESIRSVMPNDWPFNDPGTRISLVDVFARLGAVMGNVGADIIVPVESLSCMKTDPIVAPFASGEKPLDVIDIQSDPAPGGLL